MNKVHYFPQHCSALCHALHLVLRLRLAVVDTVWSLQLLVHEGGEDGQNLLKVGAVRGVLLPAALHQVVAVGKEGETGKGE